MLRTNLAIAALFGAACFGSVSADAGDVNHSAPYCGNHGVQQAGFYSDENPDEPLSAWECWWEDIRDCVRARRLKNYKRHQRMHRKFLYPEYSVACSPTFGYHHTQWRQFPECDYIWTSEPAASTWPATAPGSPPAVLTPMLEPAPDASTTSPPAYFPEPAPQITPVQPAIPPAPGVGSPSETDAAHRPISTDSLIEFVSHPRAR